MNQKFSPNDILNMFNSIVKDNNLYNIEQFCLAFMSLSSEEKQNIYSDVDFLGNDLLMDSIEYLKPDFSMTLIDLGFNPNIQNIKGINPLINAIKHNQEDLALHLIEITHDLDFARSSNGKKNGDTALIYATDHGMFNIVKKLIDYGADPFYKNEFNQHALFYCLKKDEQYLKIFDYLIGIYKEESFIRSILGTSILELIFKKGSVDHLNIIASHNLEFPDFSQKEIDLLKNTQSSSYSSKDSNSYETFLELINYWDKLKEKIRLNNKLINKPGVKTKTVKI